MTDYIVWMDTENAKIFALGQNGIVKTHLEKTGVDHHTVNKKDHHGNSDQEHFFRDLAKQLGGADKLLLLGPGQGKTEFVTHLHTHKDNLAKKIIGTETTDHPSEPQILAKARTYFKAYAHWDN